MKFIFHDMLTKLNISEIFSCDGPWFYHSWIFYHNLHMELYQIQALSSLRTFQGTKTSPKTSLSTRVTSSGTLVTNYQKKMCIGISLSFDLSMTPDNIPFNILSSRGFYQGLQSIILIIFISIFGNYVFYRILWTFSWTINRFKHITDLTNFYTF